jgi:3-dehydroshikimate dehydratase
MQVARRPDPRDRWPVGAFGDEIAVSLEEQLDVLAAAGVPYLELRAAWGVNVVDMSAAQLETAAGLLRQAGVRVSAIASPVGKAPIQGDFGEELDRLRRAFDVASAVSTSLVRVFSFLVPAGGHAEHRDEVLRRLASFAEEADRRGFTLVHENESYIYGDTAEHCRELLTGVDSPALLAAFDPANFVQVGVQPHSEAWPCLAHHVAHFHVKDAVRVDRSGLPPYPAPAGEDRLMASVRLPGEGEAGLTALLGELDRSGYAGVLVLEPHLQGWFPELTARARFERAVEALRSLTAPFAGRLREG